MRESEWFTWPGYLWFGLAGYLFLSLLVVEPVRLPIRGWTRRTAPPAEESTEPPVDAGLNQRIFPARAGAVAAGAASVRLSAWG